jgi:hypothetical protein
MASRLATVLVDGSSEHLTDSGSGLVISHRQFFGPVL